MEHQPAPEIDAQSEKNHKKSLSKDMPSRSHIHIVHALYFVGIKVSVFFISEVHL